MAKKRAKRKPSKKKKKRTKSGCAIWLIPLILGLVLFFSNEKVRTSFGNFIKSLKSKTASKTNKDHDNKVIKNIIRDDINNRQPALLTEISKKLKIETSKPDKKIKKTTAVKNETKKMPVITKKLMRTKIYFIRYDSKKDLLSIIPINKTIDKNDSPAYTTLQTLFNGPSKRDEKKGYQTLIPHAVKINTMKVKKGILYLDLSETFLTRRQKLGREGLLLQLYQIVNSMVNFSTIKGIRFSFDGKIIRTSGGDGVLLNKTFYFKKNPLL